MKIKLILLAVVIVVSIVVFLQYKDKLKEKKTALTMEF